MSIPNEAYPGGSPPDAAAPLADHALWHHRRGEADGSTWVTAARPGTKAAYLPNWNRQPFKVEREVIAHWRDHPNDNPVLVPRPGHFWLDVDFPAVLDEAEDANGPLDRTYTQQSLNGRLQLLLKGDVTSSGKVYFDGKLIGETRGAGTGQCVAAGSRGTTDSEKTRKPAAPGTWSIDDLSPLAEAPAWLLTLIKTGGPATHGEKRRDYGQPIEWDTIAARALITAVERGERVKDYEGPFGDGERNSLTYALFAEACNRMVHPDAMLEEVLGSGIHGGLDECEVERCQRSVYYDGNVQGHYGEHVPAYWLPNHVFRVYVNGEPQGLRAEDPVAWKARCPHQLPMPGMEQSAAASDAWEDIPEATGDDIMRGEIVRLVPVLGSHDDLYLPQRDVTFFAGPGGAGKSTEANGVALDVWNGLSHHGLSTVRMPALIVNFDDSLDVMKLGIRKCAHGRDVGGVTLVSMFGRDMTLRRPLASRDQSETPFHKWLSGKLERMGPGPKLAVLDHLGALFAGDYQSKPEILAFIACVRAICVQYDATILILAHPSAAATTSGDLTFGAAAWRDYVRMYWTFDYERDAKGNVVSDVRILSRKKVNHGKSDAKGTGLRLEWKQGRFVLAGRAEVPARPARPDGRLARWKVTETLTAIDGALCTYVSGFGPRAWGGLELSCELSMPARLPPAIANVLKAEDKDGLCSKTLNRALEFLAEQPGSFASRGYHPASASKRWQWRPEDVEQHRKTG